MDNYFQNSGIKLVGKEFEIELRKLRENERERERERERGTSFVYLVPATMHHIKKYPTSTSRGGHPFN